MANMAQAIRMALHVGESRFGVTDVFGEDVGPPMGGAFTLTQGLKTAWNSPLDERGIIGAEMLNDALQNLLNPSDKPVFRAGRRFHVADKVMQIKNNYDKNVYNGDVGRIVEVGDNAVIVRFDEKEVEYALNDLDELVLAYATSVHKYQGSECPCIVMPIHTQHFKLLQRNLLYTAVNRGKRQVYLVGTTKAIAIAVHNNQVQTRYTGLEKAITETAKTFQLDTHRQLEFT